MRYNSVDEIDTLSFRDATIVRCVFSAKQGVLEFELDGAVVRENNSANELYTDRYASDMQVRFVNPEMEAILLEGHSYYDANDVLIETVPDKPVEPERYDEIMKSFEGKVIFFAGTPKENLKSQKKDSETGSEAQDKKCFQMIIDVEEDSYVVSFYYDKVIAEWEHFMNKVMI